MRRTYFDEAHGGCAIEDDLPKDSGAQQAGLPKPLRACVVNADAVKCKSRGSHRMPKKQENGHNNWDPNGEA